MVLQAIGSTLTYAVGIMVSPLPVIAILVILMGKSARVNGVAFTFGWFVSVLMLIYFAIRVGQTVASGQPTLGQGLLQVAVGVLFLVFAFLSFRTGYRTRHDPQLPKWMAKTADMNVIQVVGLAVVLQLTNVKNIPLAAQAVTAVGPLSLNTAQQWITAILFSIIASLPFLVPTIWMAVGGEGAKREMGHAKDFLQKYNQLIMGALFLMMGSQAFGGGLQIVAAKSQ